MVGHLTMAVCMPTHPVAHALIAEIGRAPRGAQHEHVWQAESDLCRTRCAQSGLYRMGPASPRRWDHWYWLLQIGLRCKGINFWV
jgi:hypothetical protein